MSAFDIFFLILGVLVLLISSGWIVCRGVEYFHGVKVKFEHSFTLWYSDDISHAPRRWPWWKPISFRVVCFNRVTGVRIWMYHRNGGAFVGVYWI